SQSGVHPEVPLIQHTNGTLFGDTYEGGTAGKGELYSLGMGLGPFVTFLPAQSQGRVGKTIGILGQGFTGTTAVSFNGTQASFQVVSDPYLTATVPDGATTGPIQVATGHGQRKSNKVFRVLPQISSFTPTSGTEGTPVTIAGTSLTGTIRVT